MTRLRSILWSLGTVFLAAIVSFYVARKTQDDSASTNSPSEQGFHDWLHDNLAITQEQEDLLHLHEIAFEKDRIRIREEIESTGHDLANAIRRFNADSTEVLESRERLTRLQGELQQATLDHFFAMKKHLTEEQGEKLLRWTHDSIIHGHHD